ncbi:hypothetical protein SLEP1_g7416 [Rubroshorea leprosula]|uniref:Uncharacterized protein n=1 Tax=Rubroshorea leprosula TaxID=152421 RepID=A0AAV5I6M2_9ROSI|nr:hypothetical protein SLEP1_g7416 [Rubroshorea leprosula]
MKHPVRPLLSILLLIAVTATFSSRITVRRSTIFSPKPQLRIQSLPPPVFNSTLLKFAAIQLGEEDSKQEIEQLLQGNFSTQLKYRSFFTWWRRSNSDHREKGARTSTGSPENLKSSEFNQDWLDFRRNLHDWARNKMFQPDVMLDLVRLVKHRIDGHNGLFSSDKKYKSCAVVGNSGILLNSNYGELIDSHEVVIRLNNAWIRSYEHKVGSKISISFVNSNIFHLCSRSRECFCHPYGAEVPIIMYICQPIHFLDYTVCNSYYKAPLLITDSRFDVLCAQIVKYYSAKRFVEETGKPLEEWDSTHEGVMFHYSSGMQAIMLALGICDSVGVFGFGKSPSARHHYHSSQKAELTLHDYEAEYAFYHDLVENPQAIPFISDKFRFPPVVIYQ